MAEFLNAVSAVFLLFSLMAVGYFLGVFGWMGSGEKKFLSRFVVNIAVPCNCLVGLLNNLKHEDLARAGKLVSAQELLPVYLRPPQAQRLRQPPQI